MDQKYLIIFFAIIVVCSGERPPNRPNRLPNGFYLLYKCEMPNYDWKTDTNSIMMKIDPNKFYYFKNDVEFLNGNYEIKNFKHFFSVNQTQYGVFDFTEIVKNNWVQEGFNHINRDIQHISCRYAFIEPL